MKPLDKILELFGKEVHDKFVQLDFIDNSDYTKNENIMGGSTFKIVRDLKLSGNFYKSEHNYDFVFQCLSNGLIKSNGGKASVVRIEKGYKNRVMAYTLNLDDNFEIIRPEIKTDKPAIVVYREDYENDNKISFEAKQNFRDNRGFHIIKENELPFEFSNVSKKANINDLT